MKRVKKQRSPMVHDFSRIPAANIPRSSFNLSQAYKSTFDAGYLVPFFLQEVVPGDTHSVTAHVLCRLATPLKPVMDNVSVESFFFFVPNRLTWSNWVKFMGEQDNPGDSTDFTIPRVNVANAPVGSLSDYFGLPIQNVGISGISALPFRAYNRIYRDWFKAQDLQNDPVIKTDDTADSQATDYPLLRRGKRHDYFTSCLPWPQFGPGVDLPLGTVAPIVGDGPNLGNVEIGDTSETYVGYQLKADVATVQFQGGAFSGQNLWADLSDATASTINELRQAFQIQKLQERDARGGHRYQELVLSHFGVRGGDARLNRSEYLGGGTIPMGITQIPQTAAGVIDGVGASGEVEATPQGNLAAYGVSVGKSGFTKSFTEHGYIIGLINARADLTYQRGTDRHWSRTTKYDFYWPALAKIGEQAVLNKEIFTSGTPLTDDAVFGYQERWAEMRHNNSKITGLFRSDATASLDVWHLSQDFATTPALNAEFIEDDPPIDRVIAVPGEPHFLLDAYFQHKAARPMPINGAPGYIDHF